MSTKSLYGGRNFKETLLYVSGVGLIVFGLVLVGGTIVGEPDVRDWFVLPIFLLIFWGPGYLCIYKSNASRRRRIEAVKDDLFGKIIRLAQSRGGRLYLNDLVSDLGVPLSHAEKLMQEMTIKYAETVDTDIEDSGVIAYIFPSAVADNA